MSDSDRFEAVCVGGPVHGQRFAPLGEAERIEISFPDGPPTYYELRADGQFHYVPRPDRVEHLTGKEQVIWRDPYGVPPPDLTIPTHVTQANSSYHWARIEGTWEVVEISGSEMYRASSDVTVKLADGVWTEFGSVLDVQEIGGALAPPAGREGVPVEAEDLAKQLVGRTIAGVGIEDNRSYSGRPLVGIEWIDLDDGSRVWLGVGDGTLDLPWFEIRIK